MNHRVVVYAEKCVGCRLCELSCSLVKTQTFNPRLAYQ